nr:GrpB family protein [uncultured Schaedlerella sp.]
MGKSCLLEKLRAGGNQCIHKPSRLISLIRIYFQDAAAKGIMARNQLIEQVNNLRGLDKELPQHITVVNYDSEWPLKYARERGYIIEILKDNCISVYHIGSTSVPGLAAKPIIDITVVVRSLEKVDTVAEKFPDIGYEYLGEFGIAGRRYLRKGGDERTHQIYIFQADDWNNSRRHLAFRDYMRTYEKERGEYAKIKKDLVQKFPHEMRLQV